MPYSILIDPFQQVVKVVEVSTINGWLNGIRKLVGADKVVRKPIPVTSDILMVGDYALGVKKEVFLFNGDVYRGKGVIVGITSTGRTAKAYASDIDDIRDRVKFYPSKDRKSA
jgi:hypothetical protein